MNKSEQIRIPPARRSRLPYALDTENEGNRAISVIIVLVVVAIVLAIAYHNLAKSGS